MLDLDRKIKSIQRRGARGKNRLGLKIGKQAIKKMSDSDFQRLIERIKRFSQQNNVPINKRRQYKKIKRIAHLIRQDEKKWENFTKAGDIFLDTFLPERNQKGVWLPYPPLFAHGWRQ